MIVSMEEHLTKDEKKALRQEEWKEKIDKERKNNFYKTIAAWSFGGLLLVLAIWALVAFSKGSTTTSTTPDIKSPAVTSNDYQSNPSSARLTLIEYADFQCPACKAYYPIVKQLQADFGQNLNVVYRFFPLKTIHQNAINSAKAAYASGIQGKFWEMHDKLFETQDNWATVLDPESLFTQYAKSLGLNTSQFTKDYEASSTNDFVNSSYDSAVNLGLNSTPSFFLNGSLIQNPAGYQPFKILLGDSLSKKK